MFTVNSFLCFSLETGGLVIGWFTFIGNILLALTSGVCFILLCVFSCADLIDKLDRTELDLCRTYHGVLIGVVIVLIALSVGCAYIGWKGIQGTRARDHFRVKPLMVLLGVATVLSILQISSLNAQGIVSALVTVIIDAYLFVVLYSLYNVFRQEYEGAGNRQPLQYVGKV